MSVQLVNTMVDDQNSTLRVSHINESKHYLTSKRLHINLFALVLSSVVLVPRLQRPHINGRSVIEGIQPVLTIKTSLHVSGIGELNSSRNIRRYLRRGS